VTVHLTPPDAGRYRVRVSVHGSYLEPAVNWCTVTVIRSVASDRRRRRAAHHDAGGMAFVYDEAGEFPSYVNPDQVIWQRIDSNFWEAHLQALIAEHVTETQSRFARRLINDWVLERDRFWQVVPKEMLRRLARPLSDRVEEVGDRA
jgi:glutamate synthase domain-containing protein 3